MASTNRRSWSARYAWMAGTIVSTVVAAGLTFTGMQRDRELKAPYLFRLETIEIRGHHYSRIGPLWLSIALAVALYALYLRTTHKAHLRRRLEMPTTVGLGPDPRVVGTLARGVSVDDSQAQFFWEALQYPTRVFARISESVETYTRTTKIHTNYTINLPSESSDAIVPLLLVRTGTVVSGLRILDSSADRLSSESQVQSLSYVVAILDYLVAMSGRREVRAYTRGGELSLRTEITALLCRGYVSDDAMMEETPRVLHLLDALSELRGSPTRYLDMAVDIVASLYGVYPICVRIRPKTTTRAGGTVRCSLERRVLTPVLQRHETPDTIRLLREIPTRFVTAREWYGTSEALALGISLLGAGLLDLFTDTVRRVFDFLRRVFGIRSSHVVISLASAALTNSYHLSVSGPEGNYLVRQNIVDARGREVDDVIDDAPLYRDRTAAVEPAGQRHSNVYLTGGLLSWRESYYRAQFFERPPGSTGIAALSALSSALIVWVLAVRYGPDGIGAVASTAPGDPSGVLQILLAFPLLTSAYAFMAPGQSVIGGVLSARVAAGLVGLFSVFAVGASMVPELFGPGSLTVIAGLLSVIAVGTLGSWMQRTATYQRIATMKARQ